MSCSNNTLLKASRSSSRGLEISFISLLITPVLGSVVVLSATLVVICPLSIILLKSTSKKVDSSSEISLTNMLSGLKVISLSGTVLIIRALIPIECSQPLVLILIDSAPSNCLLPVQGKRCYSSRINYN